VEGARPAVPADLPRLAQLHRAAHVELVVERGGEVFLAREARPEPAAADFEAAMADNGRGVWVGTIEETPMGYLVARVEDLRNGRVLGVIDDIFVEAGARAVGIGEAMMDLAMAWFREQSCSGVDAYALPGMRATKNFFETFGFTARLLGVHHRREG